LRRRFFERYMDDNLKREKLELWKKQEQDLKKQQADAMKRKGEAAQEGDLKENAAYLAAIEEVEMVTVRLASLRNMIQELETDLKS
jgi:transcription elongation GreA/GreB family factor